MYGHTVRSSRTLLAGVLVAFGMLAVPVAAHHGWGGYHETQFDLSGTVETAVSLAGPHATMRIQADGKVWDVVLAPSTRTARAGLKEGIIPLGAQVTVSGHRHRDPNKYEVKTERVNWNGKTFNVYPDRS